MRSPQYLERYRLQAEDRYRRLDDVLQTMDDDDNTPTTTPKRKRATQ